MRREGRNGTTAGQSAVSTASSTESGLHDHADDAKAPRRKINQTNLKRVSPVSGGVYEYFKSSGVFALLKPALLAVDKHRPDDAKAYLSTFLSIAVTWRQ